MRVISGSFRGRRLRTIAGNQTRPTSGMVREAVFSSLQAVTAGSVWLDLFAGSGSIGIEALSRGAKFCWFVEQNHQACKTIRYNLDILGISEERAILLGMDAQHACALIAREWGRVIELAYLDPPYAKGDVYVKAITAIEEILLPGGLVVIEHSRDFAPIVSFAERLRTKQYGLSAVSFYQRGKGD